MSVNQQLIQNPAAFMPYNTPNTKTSVNQDGYTSGTQRTASEIFNSAINKRQNGFLSQSPQADFYSTTLQPANQYIPQNTVKSQKTSSFKSSLRVATGISILAAGIYLFSLFRGKTLENKNVKRMLDEAIDRVDDLTSDNKALRGEVSELNGKIGSISAEIRSQSDKISKTIQNLQTQFDEMNKTVQNLQGQINGRNEELNGVQAQLKSIFAKIESQKSRMDGTDIELQNKLSSISEIRSQLDKISKTIQNMQAKTGAKDREFQNLQTQFNEMNKTVKNLQTQTGGKGGELKDIKTQVKNLNAEIQRLQTEMSEIQTGEYKEISELEEKIKQLKTELQRLEGSTKRSMEEMTMGACGLIDGKKAIAQDEIAGAVSDGIGRINGAANQGAETVQNAVQDAESKIASAVNVGIETVRGAADKGAEAVQGSAQKGIQEIEEANSKAREDFEQVSKNAKRSMEEMTMGACGLIDGKKAIAQDEITDIVNNGIGGINDTVNQGAKTIQSTVQSSMERTRDEIAAAVNDGIGKINGAASQGAETVQNTAQSSMEKAKTDLNAEIQRLQTEMSEIQTGEYKEISELEEKIKQLKTELQRLEGNAKRSEDRIEKMNGAASQGAEAVQNGASSGIEKPKELSKAAETAPAPDKISGGGANLPEKTAFDNPHTINTPQQQSMPILTTPSGIQCHKKANGLYYADDKKPAKGCFFKKNKDNTIIQVAMENGQIVKSSRAVQNGKKLDYSFIKTYTRDSKPLGNGKTQETISVLRTDSPKARSGKRTVTVNIMQNGKRIQSQTSFFDVNFDEKIETEVKRVISTPQEVLLYEAVNKPADIPASSKYHAPNREDFKITRINKKDGTTVGFGNYPSISRILSDEKRNKNFQVVMRTFEINDTFERKYIEAMLDTLPKAYYKE